MMQEKLKFVMGLLLASAIFIGNVATARQVTIKIEKDKEKQQKEPFRGERPAADIAILLDTSNSMDGLIHQAKSQLWTIVQQFANAKKAGKTPVLRVAVFEYGNTGLPASEGYIRQVVGLTDDLDKVSAALFGLTTNGGDEYCGMVIDEALKRLDWNNEPNAYKAIFIAGNEPFTQGTVDYQKSCKKAIESGVLVNTIHCGDYQAGVSGMWKHGADLAEGEFLNINQDAVVVSIQTPHDKILIELNEKLNRTYLWFGQKELRMQLGANQKLQDENAFNFAGGGGLGGRAGVKAGPLYSNAGRDLVDTFADDKDGLAELDAGQLPEELQQLDDNGRADYVLEKAAERKAIQREIADVNAKRLLFIENEQKKMASTVSRSESTLGDAIQSAISKQMKKSGFEFEK